VTAWAGLGLQLAIGLIEPVIVMVGLILVRSRLRHLRRTSSTATAGLGLMLVSGLLGLVPYLLLFVSGVRDGFDNVGWVIGVIGVINSLMFAAGLALVIGAVLSDRSPVFGDRPPPSVTP
jgi:hypothetical protein